MSEEVTALTDGLGALSADFTYAAAGLDALTVIFTEFYYWVTVVIMFLIHVGFCVYEVGASRRKNIQHTLMKNTLVIPLVTITFFYFGWWIYFALPEFPLMGGILENDFTAAAVPWSERTWAPT